MSEDEKELKKAGAGLMEYSPEGLMPFGPIHPSLKEPEYFSLLLEGENIVDVRARIGYVHRGIERAGQDNTWIKNIYLFERICGICSFAHSIAYSQTVEQLSGFVVPKRGRYIRTVIAELERIHSHLLWLGLVGHWAGFDTLFMWIWKDREKVLDIIEAITGNRVHKSFATLGGVRKDLPANISGPMRKEMEFIQGRVRYYLDLVSTEETLVARTRGVGRISQETARRLCPVGPLLRSTGIARDIRVEDPYAAYDDIVPEVKTSNDGDIAALLRLRLEEVGDSARMILEAMERMPGGDVKVTVPRVVPRGDAMSHVEAPRGELFYFVRSAGTIRPSRVKIRTPTMANILTATEMLKGHTLADVPVVLTGMDPCFGCMDRLAVTESGRSLQYVIDGEELRRIGVEYYSRKASH